MISLKPVLVLAVMFLSVVMIWQVATMTGFAAGQNETVPTNVTAQNEMHTVSAITCDGDNIITPSPCQNVTVNCWAIVNDSNGAVDISNVRALLGTDLSGCTFASSENVAQCYKNYNCSYTTIDDYARNYTCNFTFRHFASVTTSSLNNWSALFDTNDTDGQYVQSQATSLMYVENMTALDIVETNLDFGTMALGTQTPTNNETNSTIKNCGNGRMYVNVSGTNLPCSGTGSISVGTLRYNGTYGTNYTFDTNLTTSSKMIPRFASGNNYTPTAINDVGALGNSSVYWQINIPTSGLSGICSGNVTFYAIRV